MSYVAVVHLLRRVPSEPTRSANNHQWQFASMVAFQNGQSLVGSADDALKIVKGEMPGSKIIVWEPDWWGGIDALVEYFGPGIQCEWRYFTPDVHFGCLNCGADLVMSLR